MDNRTKIILKCPTCGKGYRLTSKKDGSTRCGICGYEAERKEFEVKEQNEKEN